MIWIIVSTDRIPRWVGYLPCPCISRCFPTCGRGEGRDKTSFNGSSNMNPPLPLLYYQGGRAREEDPSWNFSLPLRIIILDLWDDSSRDVVIITLTISRGLVDEDLMSTSHCVWDVGKYDLLKGIFLLTVLTWYLGFFMHLGGVDNLQEDLPLLGRDCFWGRRHLSCRDLFSNRAVFFLLLLLATDLGVVSGTTSTVELWIVEGMPSATMNVVGNMSFTNGSYLLFTTPKVVDSSWIMDPLYERKG